MSQDLTDEVFFRAWAAALVLAGESEINLNHEETRRGFDAMHSALDALSNQLKDEGIEGEEMYREITRLCNRVSPEAAIQILGEASDDDPNLERVGRYIVELRSYASRAYSVRLKPLDATRQDVIHRAAAAFIGGKRPRSNDACPHARVVEHLEALNPEAPTRLTFDRWCLNCGLHECRVMYAIGVGLGESHDHSGPPFTALTATPVRRFGFMREPPPVHLIGWYRRYLEHGCARLFDRNGEWLGVPAEEWLF